MEKFHAVRKIGYFLIFLIQPGDNWQYDHASYVSARYAVVGQANFLSQKTRAEVDTCVGTCHAMAEKEQRYLLFC